jgi:hypothetical protein
MKMIKRGDRAKGFRFETSSGARWNYQMENFVGLEGIVRQVRPKMNELVYPLDQYLVLQREERLKELGI